MRPHHDPPTPPIIRCPYCNSEWFREAGVDMWKEQTEDDFQLARWGYPPDAGNIAPHRFYGAYQLSHRNSGLNFAPPLLWFLPLAVSANVACGLRDRVLQFRASSLPGFMQVSLGHAQRFAAAQPIPPLRVSS